MRTVLGLARSSAAPSLAHAPGAVAPLLALWGLAGCGDPSAAPDDRSGDAGRPELDAGGPVDAGGVDAGRTDAGEACAYPTGAVEPMALGEVLSSYRWPVAIENGSGRRLDLDLVAAHCDDDDDIDWSPFDVLLFISIPAW